MVGGHALWRTCAGHANACADGGDTVLAAMQHSLCISDAALSAGDAEYAGIAGSSFRQATDGANPRS